MTCFRVSLSWSEFSHQPEMLCLFQGYVFLWTSELHTYWWFLICTIWRMSTNKRPELDFFVFFFLWWGQETELSYEILAKWKQKWTGGLLSQNPPVCVGLWEQDKAKGILWKLGVMSFPYEIMEKSERQEFLMSSDIKQNKMYRVTVYFKSRKMMMEVKLEDSTTRGESRWKYEV